MFRVVPSSALDLSHSCYCGLGCCLFTMWCRGVLAFELTAMWAATRLFARTVRSAGGAAVYVNDKFLTNGDPQRCLWDNG